MTEAKKKKKKDGKAFKRGKAEAGKKAEGKAGSEAGAKAKAKAEKKGKAGGKAKKPSKVACSRPSKKDALRLLESKACPCCGKHCPLSKPKCGKGRALARAMLAKAHRAA